MTSQPNTYPQAGIENGIAAVASWEGGNSSARTDHAEVRPMQIAPAGRCSPYRRPAVEFDRPLGRHP